MHHGKLCDRELYRDDNKCLCHSEREDKDAEDFQSELDEIFADESAEYFDLTRFVFPERGWRLPKEIKKDVHFGAVKFLGAAYIGGTHFSGRAYFIGTEFLGQAHFEMVSFVGEARFRWAQFFGKTTFSQTEFMQKADFKWLDFKGDGAIGFANMSLDNCLFIGTDCSRLKFVNVTWPIRRTLWGRKFFFRRAVADELNPEQKDWEGVADLYADLERHYLDRSRHQEANAFYIGQQDVLRKVNRSFRYWLANRLYRLFSVYGVSYVRPLLWLAAMLLLFPLVFIRTGINFGRVSGYYYGRSLSWDMYWDAVALNLSFVTFGRGEIADYLTEPWQRAIVSLETLFALVLVTFLVLALRRLFRRRTV